MPVKILHASDMHLDSPFEALPPEMAAQRRREQRFMLEKLAETAGDAGVQIVLLAGDLFDSSSAYSETHETLVNVFSRMSARVFISPGNHDHCGGTSPYSCLRFPENVHVFRTPAIESVTVDDLGCRVWGAGFTAEHCAPLLEGFRVPESDMCEIMVMHGDLGGGVYNPITPAQIAATGLDYLALGHVHEYSGVCRAGGTVYAYSGCTEGRGFDEVGEKGVIAGVVGKGSADLSFVPLGGRQYRIITVDMTDCSSDASGYIASRMPQGIARDICRVVLTGEYDGVLDASAEAEKLAGLAYHLSVRIKTKPRRDVWDGIGGDTLRGLFLRRMRVRYDAAAETEKEKVLLAVRYGLAALENGEDIF